MTKLENFILSDLLNAPLAEDILEFKNNRFYWGGTRLSLADSRNIIESARSLKRNVLFKALMSEAKREGQRRIGVVSSGWEDTRFGKALLYVSDLLEKKVALIEKLEIHESKKSGKKGSEEGIQEGVQIFQADEEREEVLE